MNKKSNKITEIIEIIEIVQQKLYLKHNRILNIQEEIILRGVWHNLSYEDIAESLYMNVGTIRNIASKLWHLLSDLFNVKINKTKFKYVFCQIINNQEIHPFEELEQEETQQLIKNKGVIMIVDDQVENLKFLRNLLIKKNYSVRCAKNANIALMSLNESLPDLILLDILMPDKNGYELCQIIKNNPDIKDIPIIFLSALNDTVDKIKGFNLGASDYITKPFEEVEVLARVSHHVNMRQQKILLENEINAHEQTIEMLYQSRSIIASILNHTPYGIAALEAIRSKNNAEIIDFHYLLVNPTFAEIFNLPKSKFTQIKSCKNFFENNGLNWLNSLIKVVKMGQYFQQTFNYQNQVYEVFAVKLGDGVNLTIRHHTV